MTKRKNPWLAMLLSLLYPGLGHAFLGEMGKGLLYITIHSFLLVVWMMTLGFLGLPALIFWIFIIISSGLRAERINKGEIKPEFPTGRSAWISFLVTLVVGLIPIYFFPFQAYFSLYDRLPSEKASVQAYLQQSLEKKYNLEAQVRQVEYSWDASDMDGRFEAEAIFLEYPNVPFQVSVHGKDSLHQPVYDTFVDAYIEKMESDRYEKRIQELLNQAAFSHSKIWVTSVNSEEDLVDIRKFGAHPQSRIRISISTIKFMNLNETNKEQLAEQIWTVLTDIHQEGINSVSFDAEIFAPKWDMPSFNKHQLSKQRITYIYIDEKTPVHSVEEIKELIEIKVDSPK